MPRLSVIMPVFNGEKSVLAAVRSTLWSMPHDSEILVLDDASYDSTPAQLRSIDDPRLRIITNSTNQGVSVSLSRLLDHVDSPFIARMDADDLTLPWRFALQMRVMERCKDVDFVFGGAIRFGSGMIPRPTLPVPYSHSLSRALLPLRNPYIHPTMLARTGSLRLAGGYRSGPAEDYDLWLRAAGAGAGLFRSSYPVICYRKHAKQVSHGQQYASKTLSDKALRENLCQLAHSVYPNIDSDFLWQLLQRRMQSAAPLEGVTVSTLRKALSLDLALSKWESQYLNRWLKKAVGKE